MTGVTHRLGPLPAGQPRAVLVDAVADVLRHLGSNALAIVACSGGPDSTVLAHLVAEARPDLRLTLGFIRHGLRDDEADLHVVEQHAEWLGIDVDVREVTVEPRGAGGPESAARDVRYAALRDIAAARGARSILLGHTADDQAETVLLRLARGTGIDGLRAMRPVNGDLVRPMLRIRRADVQRFILMEGLPTVEDPTNHDPSFRRNVVRHELLDILVRVAPDPIAALARLAELATDDIAVLDDATTQAMRVVRRIGPVLVIEDRALDDLPRATARRVVRNVLARMSGSVPDADQVWRAMELESGSALTLPGPVDVSRAGGSRSFAPQRLLRSSPVSLVPPGVAVWPPAEVTVQAITARSDPWRNRQAAADAGQVAMTLDDGWSPPPPDPDHPLRLPGGHPERMVLNVADGVGPLVVRHRQPGDRIQTVAGTKRLQDLYVDVGVPRAIRDVWPVVAVGAEQVVWVPGVAADEEVLRDGRRRPVAQLRITPT
ncbi:MAG: tRNA lysidine(34) synthetase TilS [Nitriliruptoraceae bacterium]